MLFYAPSSLKKINRRRFLNQAQVKFRKLIFIGHPRHFRQFYMDNAMLIAYFPRL